MLQPTVPLTDEQAETISQRLRNSKFKVPARGVEDAAGSQTSEDSKPLSALAKPMQPLALDNAAHEPASEQYPRQPHGKNCN